VLANDVHTFEEDLIVVGDGYGDVLDFEIASLWTVERVRGKRRGVANR